MLPKVLIYWQELVEILEKGHYRVLVEAGQEETEEKSVDKVHLEEEEAKEEAADSEVVVEQAQRLELLVVMGLESSGMIRYGVALALYFCHSFFLLFEFAVVESLGTQACWNVPNLVGHRLDEQHLFLLDQLRGSTLHVMTVPTKMEFQALAPGYPLLP